MANIWEKVISILAGNLNLGLGYLITTVKPAFMKCMLCAIYGPIWKHADFVFGKKSLNTVKLFSENKVNDFRVLLMPFCFNSVLKVNIYLSGDLSPVIKLKTEYFKRRQKNIHDF